MYRNPHGLSEDELRQYAPALYTEEARPGLSANYAFYSTIAVVKALENEGLVPVAVHQSFSRDDEKGPYVKQMVRMALAGDLDIVGEGRREVEITTSHGYPLRAFKLYLGYYRKVCSNGLVLWVGDVVRLSIPHSRHTTEDVIEGSYRILEEGEQVIEKIDELKRIELPRTAQLQLAERAHSLRFPGWTRAGKFHPSPFTPEDLLVPQQDEDEGSDAWRVYNRIQRVVIGGGFTKQDEKGHTRKVKPINNIDQNINLQHALWGLLMEVASEHARVVSVVPEMPVVIDSTAKIVQPLGTFDVPEVEVVPTVPEIVEPVQVASRRRGRPRKDAVLV